MSSLKNQPLRPWVVAGAVALLAAGVSSCKDYLDVVPVSTVDATYVFSNVDGANQAVNSAYDLLSGDYTYGQRLSCYFPYDTDEARLSGDVDNGRRGIARYAVDANNTELLFPWNALYQGVERSNVCIEGLRNSPLYNGGTAAEQATMRSLYGQVLTLRAQYLFELIRNWGDVPAPFKPAAATADLYQPSTDRDATYDRLLDDLKEAAELVPYRSTDEHISKGAIKALRARIALFRGGYSLRSDGVMHRGSNYQKYYDIARQECADIIQSGRHDLIPDFRQLFKNMNELRVDNTEILFEVAMAGSGLSSDSKFGYFTGPRIDGLSRYGLSNPGVNPLPTYFYAFDSLDTRRDVSITYYSIASSNLQSPVKLFTLTDGKLRRDWRVPLQPGTGQYLGYNWPLIRYADVLLMFAEAQNELDGPAVAFGSLSPMRALQLVRERAFRGNAGRVPAAPADKEGFFEALVRERLLEFGGEGIRKYDLLRWNRMGRTITETKANLLALKSDTLTKPSQVYWRQNGEGMQLTSFYRPKPATVPTGFKTTPVDWLRNISTNTLASGFATSFTPGKSELLPIPQVAFDVYNQSGNNVLKQNPGYQ